MEAARAAVAQHTSRRGHFTDVEELVKPAVTQQTIKPHRHEVTTEAIDREIHQHHHHTTVVPLTHSETLPTRHTHNLIPIKKVHHQHENEAETRQKLADLAANFRDRSITHPTTHSLEQAPQVVSEHHHHHVHEIVQPVIYKETLQREHVHTTVPIHEVHHAVSKHHPMSALPIKQLEEFLKFNNGREPNVVTHSHHEGPPRAYDSKLSTDFDKLGLLPNSTLTNNARASPGLDANSRLLQRKPTPPRTPRTHGSRKRHTITSSAGDPMSPVSRGSFSSASSASSLSDSAPSTPTYRHTIGPKTTTTTTMDHNNMTTGPINTSTTGPINTTTHGPLHTTTTGPSDMTVRGPGNTLINTSTHTQHSQMPTNTYMQQPQLGMDTAPPQSRIPANVTPPQSQLPINPVTPQKTVQIAEPVRIADGETSPRLSDEDNPNRRRSFMSRLTGGRETAATRRY